MTLTRECLCQELGGKKWPDADADGLPGVAGSGEGQLGARSGSDTGSNFSPDRSSTAPRALTRGVLLKAGSAPCYAKNRL